MPGLDKVMQMQYFLYAQKYFLLNQMKMLVLLNQLVLKFIINFCIIKIGFFQFDFDCWDRFLYIRKAIIKPIFNLSP